MAKAQKTNWRVTSAPKKLDIENVARGIGFTVNAVSVVVCAVIAVASLIVALATGRYALLVGFVLFGGGAVFLLRNFHSDL